MQINKEEDRIRLMEMADSIREIEAYVGRGGYADFADREDMRQAISAHLQQIGTAASLLSDEFKETYGDIDWTVLNGLQYANFDVELELDAQPLWHIVNNDLPIIGEQVLDIATLLEQQEDLEDVSLNEEDYRDLRAMRQSSEELTRLNPDEDINLVDEAESYPKQVTGDGSEEKFETNFENEHHKEDELRFPEVDIEQPITYPEDNER